MGAPQLKLRLGWYDRLLEDDGDPDFEDVIEHEDDEFDLILRHEERLEGYSPVELPVSVESRLPEIQRARAIRTNRLALFRTFRPLFVKLAVQFAAKSTQSRMGLISLTPEQFSAEEKWLWAAYQQAYVPAKKVWYDLPGDASIWATNFNYKANGWVIKRITAQGRRRIRALQQALGGRCEPNDQVLDDFIALVQNGVSGGRFKGKGRA